MGLCKVLPIEHWRLLHGRRRDDGAVCARRGRRAGGAGDCGVARPGPASHRGRPSRHQRRRRRRPHRAILVVGGLVVVEAAVRGHHGLRRSSRRRDSCGRVGRRSTKPGLLARTGAQIGVHVAGTRRGVRRVLAATETLGVQLLRLAMLATMGTLGRRSTLGLDHGQRHIRVLAARHTMPANTPVTGIFNTINKHHGPQKAIRRTKNDQKKASAAPSVYNK